MMVVGTHRVVVIDNGRGSIKAGFSGENLPTSVVPSFSTNNGPVGQSEPSPFNSLGIPENWDSLEEIWWDIFENNLEIQPTEHTILLTESPLSTRESREKMTEIMFENFGFPAIYISNRAVLSLHQSGRTSGLVVNCGYESTFAVPIYQSLPLRDATVHLNFGGKDIDQILVRMLEERGHYFKSQNQQDSAKSLKEKFCFVSFDTKKEVEGTHRRVYRLPDAQFVTIETERYRCPEIYFNPSLQDRNQPSLQNLTNDSILAADATLQSLFYGNIVTSGGTSLLPGFGERLEQEVRKLATPAFTKVTVDSPENRKYGSWVGGSLLSSISTFQNLCPTRKEYNDHGAGVVHWKCF